MEIGGNLEGNRWRGGGGKESQKNERRKENVHTFLIRTFSHDGAFFIFATTFLGFPRF